MMETVMRSAETSGVEAGRFGLSDGYRHLAALATPLRRLTSELSPVTVAVAGTALLAAGLSIVVDTVRTLDEGRTRQHIITRLAAAQPAAEWPLASAAMVTLAGPEQEK